MFIYFRYQQYYVYVIFQASVQCEIFNFSKIPIETLVVTFTYIS